MTDFPAAPRLRFGDLLRHRRRERGLTVDATLGLLSETPELQDGLTRHQYAWLEDCKQDLPPPTIFRACCDALDLSAEDVLRRLGYLPPRWVDLGEAAR